MTMYVTQALAGLKLKILGPVALCTLGSLFSGSLVYAQDKKDTPPPKPAQVVQSDDIKAPDEYLFDLIPIWDNAANQAAINTFKTLDGKATDLGNAAGRQFTAAGTARDNAADRFKDAGGNFKDGAGHMRNGFVKTGSGIKEGADGVQKEVRTGVAAGLRGAAKGPARIADAIDPRHRQTVIRVFGGLPICQPETEGACYVPPGMNFGHSRAAFVQAGGEFKNGAEDFGKGGANFGRGIGDGGVMIAHGAAGGALEGARGSVEVAGGICYVSIEAARFAGDTGLAATGTGVLAGEVAVGGAIEAGYWTQYGARVVAADGLREIAKGSAAASTAVSPNGVNVEVLEFKSPKDARKFVKAHPELLQQLDKAQSDKLAAYMAK
jgi:hypothetical protein